MKSSDVTSHHVHETGVTEQTSQIDSTHPCCLRERERKRDEDPALQLVRSSFSPGLYWSYWAGGLHLLLCDLQVGFVGVVVGVELQSLLIVTGCFCVFVEAGQSQAETQRPTRQDSVHYI